MRGTLTTKEMAQNESTPSRLILAIVRWAQDARIRTESSNNLSFHAKLVLESARKVADAATAIASNVWHLPYVVEHMTAGKQKDGNQADGGPEIPILDDGQDVWRGRNCQSTYSEDYDDGRSPPQVIDGPLDWGMWSVRQVACDPCVNLLS